MNKNDFDLDVRNIDVSTTGTEPSSTAAVCSFVSGLISGAIIGTYTGDCLTTRCNSVAQCPSPGPNPTYYSC